MNFQRLEALLAHISQLRIAVIGDFALDFYFDINPKTDEFSVETEKEVHHASQSKSYLGGAGNVSKNLSMLGVQVEAYGLRGNDVFGREMECLASDLQINTKQLQARSEIETPTYCKPMYLGTEQNRLDFGTQNKQFQHFASDVVQELTSRISTYDWIVINEQFQIPLLNQASLEYLQKKLGNQAIADLRSLGPFASETLLKVNEAELHKILGSIVDLESCVKSWALNRQKPVLVTLGEQGMIYASSTEFHWEKAIPLHGPIDTVGAGDMVVAAFSAAKAAGANNQEACQLASLAVHVSIHKTGETGSANPQEIIDAYHAARN